ncbi:MAG: LacI family DNA-binding transcriptional regulator [Eubacteriales bacterium]|nr:LacI family DNA-binding transcriptional regulator [Eubacteriales bacterium]
MVSIQIIADKAGVSCATVSRAFRNSESVSPSTYSKIMQVAKELNYRPKKYRGHSQNCVYNSTIGVIASDLMVSFYPKVIKGISTVARAHGIDVIVCDSNDDPGIEIRNLELMRTQHVNGIIFSPVADDSETTTAYMEELKKTRIPIVLLDRSLKGIGLDGVFRDDFNASVVATQCLIKVGHKYIASLAGTLNSKPGLERLNGYLSAMQQNGLGTNELVYYCSFRSEPAYQQTKVLLATHPEVTAIFSCNKEMTAGCIRAIQDAGLRIPDDIALISYGDLDSSQMYSSILTSVTQPIAPLGEECSRILIDKIEHGIKRGQAGGRRITFESKLVCRGSEQYPTRTRGKISFPKED